MTEAPHDRSHHHDHSRDPLVPAGPVGSTSGGTQEFIEQFRHVHRGGQGVQLLVYLHPGLHHEHLADTVREIVGVTGVFEVRWINRLPVSAAWLTDRARAALARFRVRAVATNDPALPDRVRGRTSQPIVVLLGPVSGDVAGLGPVPGDAALVDLVDGALRRAELEHQAAPGATA